MAEVNLSLLHCAPTYPPSHSSFSQALLLHQTWTMGTGSRAFLAWAVWGDEILRDNAYAPRTIESALYPIPWQHAVHASAVPSQLRGWPTRAQSGLRTTRDEPQKRSNGTLGRSRIRVPFRHARHSRAGDR